MGIRLGTWAAARVTAVCLWAAACAPGSGGTQARPPTPSDDPADYPVDTAVEYRHVTGTPRFVVPGAGLPADTPVTSSNNNVDIIFFEDRLFMAWRTSETHWASANSIMYVVSSEDGGEHWTREATIELGADVREPRFLVMAGTLFFYWFEAGTSAFSFEPRFFWRMERLGPGVWSNKVQGGEDAEVPWCIRVRGGVAYMTSYRGMHYQQNGESNIDVFFKHSTDGRTWTPVNPARPVVYHGGVSEVAFEFDDAGDLWAVTRNEDGDASGFGSHVCHAPAQDVTLWDCGTRSNPERLDSPWMVRHGRDLYLVARRDVGGPFDQGRADLTFEQQRTTYLVDYWNRPKRTALYRINTTTRAVEHLEDLPGAGDTAFPSVRRTGAHSFLLANYTSPLDQPDISWIEAQGSPRGTQIYLMTLEFVPR